LSDDRFDPYDDSIPISERMGMQRLAEPRPEWVDPATGCVDPSKDLPVGLALPMSKRRKESPATPKKTPLEGAQQPGQVPTSELKVDRRELASTVCEIVGLAAFSAGFWLLHVWLGLVVTGLCLVLFGVATSNLFTGPRD